MDLGKRLGRADKDPSVTATLPNRYQYTIFALCCQGVTRLTSLSGPSWLPDLTSTPNSPSCLVRNTGHF